MKNNEGRKQALERVVREAKVLSIYYLSPCILSTGQDTSLYMQFHRQILTYCISILFLVGLAHAAIAPFDLPGPQLEVKVTRANKPLPISEVPSLQAGDRLWIHPVLPDEASVHYLLVVAFLRGVTNPPPEEWFIKAETWTRRMREEGFVVTVPQGAQQVLLFLAPETRGDFTTLRSAVRGKPGAFVRAAQDLHQASLDRSRLDTYLTAVREISLSNPQGLQEHSALLARSLSIRLEQQCFDKPSSQQGPCLVQNTDELILDDGHGRSTISNLTSGAGADMIGQLSVSRVAGGGIYSAYFGAGVDLVRMLENLRTAEYQYIPALAVPEREELNLKLNNAPSFHKPMSVLVIGLPNVEPATPPTLRAVAPKEVSCMQRSSLVLPVEGAPLVFSTDMAHDLSLHIKTKSGQGVDLPAIADPGRGGFVIDTTKWHGAGLDSKSSGTIRGFWGFQSFEGPSFLLSSAQPRKWTVAPGEQMTLVVGREDVLHLQSDDTSCVDTEVLKDRQGAEIHTSWKVIKPGELEVRVPLQNQDEGPVTIAVKQFGESPADEVRLQTYAEAGHLDKLVLNEGDHQAILIGTRLDQIASVDLQGMRFTPGDLSRTNNKDELKLLGPKEAADTFHSGDVAKTKVLWKDGRSRDLEITIESQRPQVDLVAKSIDPGPTALAIQLGNRDQLPQDGKLSFVVKSQSPETFPRNEKIEIATDDGSFDVLLGLDDGALTLEDSRNVLIELEPLKTFGRSCFGALRFRPVSADGRKGDWQPLAILVRVPFLTELHCTKSSDKQCSLSGSNLFLIDSVASDPEFNNRVEVPVGFMNTMLAVPRPVGELLYIRLRDDPSIVSIASPPGIPASAKSSANPRRKTDNTTN
jgi:hypothetical protein